MVYNDAYYKTLDKFDLSSVVVLLTNSYLRPAITAGFSRSKWYTEDKSQHSSEAACRNGIRPVCGSGQSKLFGPA